MKYRRLTNEELLGLEQEFIHFLVINGIDAPYWEDIKNKDISKAEHWIEIFSDQVFDEIVSRVLYLEYFDKTELKLFKCDTNIIYLTNIISRMTFESLHSMMVHLRDCQQDYEIYHTSKEYKPDRSSEIFRMINAGAVITDGQYYEIFKEL